MENAPTSSQDDDPAPAAPNVLLRAFVVVLILNALGILWLALRSGSPPHVRAVLDAVAQTGGGLVLAYVGFWALLRYPFRITDLFAIVLLLSAAMKVTIDVLRSFSTVGILRSSFREPESYGEIFQACMLTASVLLIGSAWGLRNCHLLKIAATGQRVLTITCGTLVMPAAAGVIAFPLLILRYALDNAPHPSVLGLLLLFVFSVIITLLNLGQLIKTLTLKEELGMTEKMV